MMVFGLENYIVNEYLRAVIVLIFFFVLLKFVVFGIEKIILRITSKTKTDIDDRFVKKSAKPITALVFLVGLRVALNELTLMKGDVDTVGTIILSLIIIAVASVAYYFVDIVVFVAIKKAMKSEDSAVRKSLMSLIQGILKAVLISFVLLYILEVWGVNIGPFLAGLGVAGLAVALALQPALANIFSGVSLILDKTIKVGDLIYLDAETKGKVFHIGLRSTKILTFDNELIIVPNSKIADSKIQNIGEPDPKARVVIPFGVAYGSNIEKVKKIVLTEIKKIKNFINEPGPIVRFLEMANSSLNFKAYFYVNSYENRFASIDEANTRIYDALNKNKINIPFPQIDVHLKKK
jgi:MscS family membrane protein